MTEENLRNPASPLRQGWTLPRPKNIPGPSVWPAALALAMTMSVWGLISSLIVTGVGAVLLVTALTGWIKEIRDERIRR